MSSECEKVVLIVEQSFWQKINFWKRLRLRFHMMICKNCSEYEKESTILHRILCSLSSNKTDNHIRAEEIQQIKKALQ